MQNSLVRLKGILDVPIDDFRQNIPREGKALLNRPFNNFTIDDVHYRYPKLEKETLGGVTLRLRPGDVIGIVGESGQGKTTLLNVISGLLTPDRGKVMLDGLNIQTLRPDQRGLAYLPQDTVLVSGSLMDNVTLLASPSPEEVKRAEKACEIACLQSVVSSFPKGLKTKIGIGGREISGGQKQRVAIARAVFSGKPIIILDEATNALDEKLEKRVIKNLKTFRRDGVLIIVSHRSSSLMYCSSVFELKNGGLVC